MKQNKINAKGEERELARIVVPYFGFPVEIQRQLIKSEYIIHTANQLHKRQ